MLSKQHLQKDQLNIKDKMKLLQDFVEKVYKEIQKKKMKKQMRAINDQKTNKVNKWQDAIELGVPTEEEHSLTSSLPNQATVVLGHNIITMEQIVVGPRVTPIGMECPHIIGMNPCIKKSIILLREGITTKVHMVTIEDGKVLLGPCPTPEGGLPSEDKEGTQVI